MSSLTDNAAPSLIVIDETHERADLAERKEVKFEVRNADVGKLRSLLKGPCRPVIHAERVSQVRSIYFDDFRMSNCAANIDGLGSRRKLRLRWYDLHLPANHCYLEIKWREHRLTGKHRLRVQSDRPVSEMSFTELRKALEASVPDRFAAMMLKYPEPTILVEYHREHFEARNSQYRLTLDYNIRFYDQTGCTSMRRAFGQPLERVTVIEAKALPGHERELRGLLHPFQPRATRCSKYVYGCQTLGLTNELL